MGRGSRGHGGGGGGHGGGHHGGGGFGGGGHHGGMGHHHHGGFGAGIHHGGIRHGGAFGHGGGIRHGGGGFGHHAFGAGHHGGFNHFNHHRHGWGGMVGGWNNPYYGGFYRGYNQGFGYYGGGGYGMGLGLLGLGMGMGYSRGYNGRYYSSGIYNRSPIIVQGGYIGNPSMQAAMQNAAAPMPVCEPNVASLTIQMNVANTLAPSAPSISQSTSPPYIDIIGHVASAEQPAVAGQTPVAACPVVYALPGTVISGMLILRVGAMDVTLGSAPVAAGVAAAGIALCFKGNVSTRLTPHNVAREAVEHGSEDLFSFAHATVHGAGPHSFARGSATAFAFSFQIPQGVPYSRMLGAGSAVAGDSSSGGGSEKYSKLKGAEAVLGYEISASAIVHVNANQPGMMLAGAEAMTHCSVVVVAQLPSVATQNSYQPQFAKDSLRVAKFCGISCLGTNLLKCDGTISHGAYQPGESVGVSVDLRNDGDSKVELGSVTGIWGDRVSFSASGNVIGGAGGRVERFIPYANCPPSPFVMQHAQYTLQPRSASQVAANIRVPTMLRPDSVTHNVNSHTELLIQINLKGGKGSMNLRYRISPYQSQPQFAPSSSSVSPGLTMAVMPPSHNNNNGDNYYQSSPAPPAAAARHSSIDDADMQAAIRASLDDQGNNNNNNNNNNYQSVNQQQGYGIGLGPPVYAQQI